ncbi:MAG: hypothetical protein J6C23_06080 [Clostridia bacterium]|nr:hypothetical protein [Clostridia bacterium]
MNKKVKALVGSALAIAMSMSVAAAGTFALFTDKAEVNVAITAGKVDVEAAVNNFKIYSMDRECANNTFENLGSASLDGNKIILTNITPGDKVVFDLNLSSGSNVKTKVRTVIYETGADDGLLKGLKVTVNGVEANLTNGAIESAWETVDPNDTLDKTMTVSIELPVEAGNEYQEKVAELRFVIEAVQWNAEVESNTSEKKIVINSVADFVEFADSVNAGNAYSGWNVFLNTNIDLDGANWAPINGFKGTFNGQGYEVSDFVVNVDGNFAGLFGKAHGNITNLSVDNAYIAGKHWVGGIVGYNYGSVTKCSVTNSTIVGADATLNDGDKVGGIVGQIMEKGQGTAGYTVSDNTVKNVTLVANRDVGGIAGALARANNVKELERNTVENVDIYYQVDKSYEEAGAIISQRQAVTVSDTNKATNVTITKLNEGTVVVAHKQDLLALSNQKIEGTVELIADIDLEGADFAPIAAAYGKSLTVNGNGHTIKNVNIVDAYHNSLNSHAMFYAYTNSTLTINDLVIEKAVVKALKDVAGYTRNYGAAVVVGYADGGSTVNLNNVDVINCSVENDTDEAALYVAYVTGNVNMTDCDTTGCTVVGAVDTDDKTSVGIGHLNGGKAVLTNCTKDITTDGWADRNDGLLIVDGVAICNKDANVNTALAAGYTEVYLNAGTYAFNANGINGLVINGTKEAVIVHTLEGEGGADYSFKDSTVIMNGVTIKNNQGVSYPGYAYAKITFNKCTFDGTYGTYADTTFNECTFNVAGDAYNLWTWGALNVKVDGCTFNSDGKAILLYGQVNTTLTVENCKFYDNGGLSDLKAAIEIGDDYNKSYNLIVNNTVVYGYEINDKGIVTGTTLWANKNSMGTDKLNVVVDGVDVY